ncbi:multidrug resistance protein; tetracycline resistance determinant [Planococcus donghaensis MPA1U2]|uniref:Multidrug resistance protein tetracycline resistance determinant n=1 Tax=Planococcus donghaensis MPA1U2 TaxID=933115 RepID=E7RK50_9BACL|nr:MFS transporter [Planococcus donghaensis]EGA88656.1 multidrug resistance protein; tetracycline resistance determinant [Planococcus donghaensis MPA1U2]
MSEEIRIKQATFHLYTFTVSKLISTFGSSVYAFGISLYVLALTGSAASFAINLICSILPRSILSPFAGYVADKYSKKATIILSQLASMLAVAGLLGFGLLNGLSLPAIYTTTALLSVSTMFTGVTFSSSIANLIDPDRIQRAMGFNQSAVSIAAIGGPVVGGILFGFVSMNVFLMIQVGAYALAVLLESTMNFRLYTNRNEQQSDNTNSSMLKEMREGFLYLKSNRVIMVIVTTAVGINFFFSSMMIGLPFIAVQQLQIDATHFGMIEAMIAIGMLLASIYFSISKEVGFPLLVAKRGILAMSVLLAGMGLPLIIGMSYNATVGYFLLLMLIFGISNVFVNTPIGVMMQKDVAEEYRGRVFGILESMAMAMMPLGYLLFGLLYDLMPAEYVVGASSICLLVLTNYLMRSSVMKEAMPALQKI